MRSVRMARGPHILLGLLLGVSGCDEGSPAARPPATLLRDDAGVVSDQDAGPPVDCRTAPPDLDADRDGASRERGDCNDCDARVNRRAFDVPDNGVDEDCSGEDATAGSEPPCDAELDPDSVDPEDLARALGGCRFVSQRSRNWGVISARLSGLDGSSDLESPLQVWLAERFGTLEAREGGRLLVLSTGVARDVEAEDYTPGCDTFLSERTPGAWSYGQPPPEGYPKDSQVCGDGVVSSGAPAYNTVLFELTLRAPSNARSLSFDSIFFSYEYPDFVCQAYNDFFVVFADPAPRTLDDANVVFDGEGDPIGVNTGLLEVCRESRRAQRDVDCELGPTLLAGTGYDRDESSCQAEVSDESDIGGASTGWLHTSVPVKPGERMTLRFLLWDSGDPLLDSTVVLDNLTWSVEATALATAPITAN